ncbi:unnamed protein product [Diamesa tonsa]
MNISIMLYQCIVAVVLTVLFHQTSASNCDLDLIHAVFTDLCNELACFRNSYHEIAHLTTATLKDMIAKSVEKYEKGELTEKNPKVVEAINSVIKEMIPPSRRIDTCQKELAYYGIYFINQTDCIEDFALGIFSNICKTFNCFPSRRQLDGMISRDDLEELIENELEKIENGEEPEIDIDVEQLILRITGRLKVQPLIRRSHSDEAVVDCMTDLAHNVFSGIFSSFNSANRRQGKSMTVEDLRILIEQELERIERGEVVEIIPSIVEMIQLIVKEMMGANRRSHR